jgi:RNA polymerase sigma-70 factor (ECF subfamily)
MAQSSPAAAYESLLEEHRRILFAICYSFCRNPAEREDLAQEIAIQLWRAFPTYDGRAKFSTWMYRVALNAAISSYRKERTRTRHLAAPDERLLETVPAPDPQDHPRRRELYAYLDTLDPLSKALVHLYFEGHTYAEIASILGIGESNAASRLSRLKQVMKEHFAQDALP